MLLAEYHRINYKELELPEELLTSFAIAMVPEIRKFYDSEDGRSYFRKWLTNHPEFAHSTNTEQDL